MKEFDIAAFLKAGGSIYAPDQNDWLSVLNTITSCGIPIGFNYLDFPSGAENYPYIFWYAYYENVSATRSADPDRIKEIIEYPEFTRRLCAATDPTSAASPGDIISMLYGASCV